MTYFQFNLSESGSVMKLAMAAVLLALLFCLPGCVTREIKEDPWNVPPGTVNAESARRNANNQPPPIIFIPNEPREE